jgi:hypothetical protein
MSARTFGFVVKPPPAPPAEAVHTFSPRTVVQRTVVREWIAAYECRRFQISRDSRLRPRPGSKVTVDRWLDGSIHLLVNGKTIPFDVQDTIAARQEVLAS